MTLWQNYWPGWIRNEPINNNLVGGRRCDTCFTWRIWKYATSSQGIVTLNEEHTVAGIFSVALLGIWHDKWNRSDVGRIQMLIISFLATVHASLLRSVRQRGVLDCLAFQSLAEPRFEKCNIDSEDITLVDCASHGKYLNCKKKKKTEFSKKICNGVNGRDGRSTDRGLSPQLS